MRLTLNLATHPYENARAFFLRWGALLAAVGAVTALLLWLAISGLLQARDVNRRIRADRAQIARLQQEEKSAIAVLEQPQNRAIRERSAFLNELIARKAFSWTEALTELEKIMPTRLHVVSIRPELDADNQLEIRMNLAGDSREKLLDLLRKMEDSPRFRQPQLESEVDNTQGTEMQFQISALYVPAPAGAAQASTRASSGGTQ